MSHAGIDFDTHAVHLVVLEDSGAAVYDRFELAGADAFDRTRSVRDALPARSAAIWDEVVAIGIEEPQGAQRATVAKLKAIQGAVLACLPRDVLVHPLVPAAWRKACGLPGNATKEAIALYVGSKNLREGRYPFVISQDACDAYCLALAVSRLVEPVPSETRAA